MVMVASAGRTSQTPGAGAMRSGLLPFDPRFLTRRLDLDAINEATRRGIVAPVFVDGFNRADGSLGSAETGQAYSVVSGTWSIASGTAKTGLTDSLAVVVLGITMANLRFSYRTRTTNTASVSQLMIRYIDANNYIGCYHLPGVGLRIFKFDGGVSTTLATAGAVKAANIWNTVELRATGNQIDAYLDGVLTTQATLAGADATKFGSTTGIAIGRNGGTSATVEIDDISISSGASTILLDQWSDDSGNSYHFTQATLLKQPRLIYTMNPAGFLVPVVRLDGVDDNLIRSSTDVSSAALGHIHCAMMRHAIGVTGGLFTTSDEASTTRFFELVSDTTNKLTIAQRNNDTADTVAGNTTLAANTPYIHDLESSGSAYSMAVNGVAQTLTVSAGSNTGDWTNSVTGNDSFLIGALKRTTETNFLSGDYCRVIVTNTQLGSNLLPLDRFMSQRYGMAITI